MNQSINANRLFLASCFALITTALSFSIRAGILSQLGTEYGFTAAQLGTINSMWFLGFPLSMVVGGLVYNSVGPQKIMQFAFFAHAVGILLTIYSGGNYSLLLISTLLIGLGNGCTEAACNPMIADSYDGIKMSEMLNKFHMWFPGGIVLGALISKFMTDAGTSWQAQIWVIMIPTLIYAFLFWGQAFPKPKAVEATSLSDNLKAMANPLFIFIFIFMALTSISEFGPQSWVGVILSKSGADPMLLLAITTGTMAVIRFFAGPIVKALQHEGVLLGSAILATIGLFLLSSQTGTIAYASAFVYACGIGLFWPNMLGIVADKVPATGAIGMSLIGAIGMFSSSIFQPIIGQWIDTAKANAEAQGLTGDALELAAGQEALSTMVLFPGICILGFIGLYFWMKSSKKEKVLA